MKDHSSVEGSKAPPSSPRVPADLAAILDSLPVLTWVSGPDKSGIFFNRAWLETTGRTLEQELGDGWIDSVHLDDLPILHGCTEAFADRRSFEIEFRLRRHDGSWRWLLDKAVPRFSSDGTFVGFVGCCMDVTEKKGAEAAVLANERRIASILESISDGFATVDRDWRITYVNPKAEQMLAPLLGSPRHFIGRSLFEVLPQIPGTPFFNAYRKAMEEQLAVNIEAFYAPLESWFDVRCYPSAEGLAIHFMDIGPRKRAEEALRWSEERFRAMADNLPLIVWLRDAEMRLEFVNHTFCSYFAVQREQVMAGNWCLPTHGDDASSYLEEFQTCVRERRSFHGEVEVRRGDGEWRWLESWANPRVAADGTYCGHIGTSADITERKRAEELRKLLLMELNHRVKNTLAIVQAIAFQSLRSDRPPDEQRALFEGRLRALASAHDVLTSENWEKASLADLVSAAAQACGCGPDRLVARGPIVTLPPKRSISVALALHELFTNATKYGAPSGSNGRVLIEWNASADDGRGLQLVWAEHGGPPVSPPRRTGFGTRLLQRTLSADLDAAVEITYYPSGLICTVTSNGCRTRE